MMELFRKLFAKKDAEKNAQTTLPSSGEHPIVPTDYLMTSQLPALYLKYQDAVYRDAYLKQLTNITKSHDRSTL